MMMVILINSDHLKTNNHLGIANVEVTVLVLSLYLVSTELVLSRIATCHMSH